MGYSRYNEDDWGVYSSTTSTKKTNEIFTKNKMEEEFDPSKIELRESRDSDLNPNSTAIIINADVTGSMGILADNLIRKGIGTVFEEILKRESVSDPHLMIMANGDIKYDNAPLQAAEFEADAVTLATQLERIYIEHGGGNNSWESYNLPWYFAAEKTAIDCFEKRGKKGYLFTIGDEQVPEDLTREQVQEVFGIDIQQESISNRSLLAMVSRKFEVFHLVAEEGNHCQYHKDAVYKSWRELLGQRVIPLVDHTKLSEVIVSIIEINEGKDRTTVIDSWDGTTSLVVGAAVEDMSLVKTEKHEGLVTL